VARGGVKLESDVGLIDAQIGTRWAQAASQLGADAAEMRFETPDAAPAASRA
jgi:flagellar biosynthesis/type III secretory pathway protein FliH